MAKKGANTVYHLLDDNPPGGKLTTSPYRLAPARSRCPFTLINLLVFLFQLYQSNLSEDTLQWSVNTLDRNTHPEKGEFQIHGCSVVMFDGRRFVA